METGFTVGGPGYLILEALRRETQEVCVCVCVCEREREGERECVWLCVCNIAFATPHLISVMENLRCMQNAW